MITKEKLIEFEASIAEAYNSKIIKAPIHLAYGNEDAILKIFKKIKKTDWVLCTWRNHYQALCKGVPEDVLKEKIIQGRSMVLSLPEYRIMSSSIVGGIPLIATGIGLGIKYRLNLFNTGKINLSSEEYTELLTQRVWCWIGDMSAETGSFHEAFKYSTNFKLPITWIIESNGKSVTTPTKETWGYDISSVIPITKGTLYLEGPNYIFYTYTNDKYPHAGAGKWIKF